MTGLQATALLVLLVFRYCLDGYRTWVQDLSMRNLGQDPACLSRSRKSFLFLLPLGNCNSISDGHLWGLWCTQEVALCSKGALVCNLSRAWVCARSVLQ